MRIYKNFSEAVNEIRRDLAEMGIDVHPDTMQDKFVGDSEEYDTKELQNYIYTVINPAESLCQLNPTQPWADGEFFERTSNTPMNPGEAYKLRDDVWNEFLHDGKFSYTYPERMYLKLERVIEEALRHPNSRQLYLSIWDPKVDTYRAGEQVRIPCSLGYLFQIRRGQLDITYFMRSCDFVTHFQNDVYLATKLMIYVAKRLGVKPGNFTHYVGSMHVYKKDVKDVF